MSGVTMFHSGKCKAIITHFSARSIGLVDIYGWLLLRAGSYLETLSRFVLWDGIRYGARARVHTHTSFFSLSRRFYSPPLGAYPKWHNADQRGRQCKDDPFIIHPAVNFKDNRALWSKIHSRYRICWRRIIISLFYFSILFGSFHLYVLFRECILYNMYSLRFIWVMYICIHIFYIILLSFQI